MDKLKLSCNSLKETASERKKGRKEEKRKEKRKEKKKGFAILVLHKGEWESLKETVV